MFMWCAPRVVHVPSPPMEAGRLDAERGPPKPKPVDKSCPTDFPAGATTKGAKPMAIEGNFNKTAPWNCVLTCTQNSDCGGGASCVDEKDAINASMCSWPLA
jgi:hypothetical protein